MPEAAALVAVDQHDERVAPGSDGRVEPALHWPGTHAGTRTAERSLRWVEDRRFQRLVRQRVLEVEVLEPDQRTRERWLLYPRAGRQCGEHEQWERTHDE